MTKKKKKPEPVKIWYTLQECAKLLGIYTNDVRELIKDQRIGMEIDNGYIMVNKKDIDKYLE